MLGNWKVLGDFCRGRRRRRGRLPTGQKIKFRDVFRTLSNIYCKWLQIYITIKFLRYFRRNLAAKILLVRNLCMRKIWTCLHEKRGETERLGGRIFALTFVSIFSVRTGTQGRMSRLYLTLQYIDESLRIYSSEHLFLRAPLDGCFCQFLEPYCWYGRMLVLAMLIIVVGFIINKGC